MTSQIKCKCCFTRTNRITVTGTNNDNPHDDFTTRTGVISGNNMPAFMNSYELSGKIECQLQSTVTPDSEHVTCNRRPNHRKCSKFFQHASSPLSTCFQIIDASPYKVSACKSGAQFVVTSSLCAGNDVLRMP